VVHGLFASKQVHKRRRVLVPAIGMLVNDIGFDC
jgi:hypothetical protein